MFLFFLVFGDHTSAINTLWGIFQVVSLALFGFIYKEQRLRINWLALSALSIGFLDFAFGNQAAMTRSQKVLCAVVEQINSDGALATVSEESGMKKVLEALSARTVNQMRMDHSTFTIGVILLIWVPFLLDRLRAGKDASSNLR